MFCCSDVGRLRRPFRGVGFLRTSASPRGGAQIILPLHGIGEVVVMWNCIAVARHLWSSSGGVLQSAFRDSLQDESFRFDYFFRFPRVSLRSALGYTLMNPFGFGFSVHRVSLQSRASKADNAPLGARKIILPVHGYKPVCQNNIRQFLND